ncbi:MAG: Na+/H+ antiporter NhaA [Acidimicrobiia bacterium]
MEAFSGLVLFAAAAVALVWANADGGSYTDVWTSSLTLGIGDVAISLDLRHWVNDLLMAVFFLVVGLEIKREVVDGELRDLRTAALPALAAVGGLVAPALIFVAIAGGGSGSRGWAIPMATDIAFAVGALALLGSRVVPGLKLFLLTLAIVDDIGAILVIAIFYSKGIAFEWLAASVAVVLGIVGMKRLSRLPMWLYALPAVALWICLHESGVHAAISGVVLGLLAVGAPGPARGPLEKFEDAVHPWSSFVIVPLFGLANAGVALGGAAIDRATDGSLAPGIVAGLVVGKTLGIAGAVVLGIRLGLGRLPRGVTMLGIIGVAMVAGIGFTVSLFVADLSFVGARLEEAKVGILAASLIAGALGAAFLAIVGRSNPKTEAPS